MLWKPPSFIFFPARKDKYSLYLKLGETCFFCLVHRGLHLTWHKVEDCYLCTPLKKLKNKNVCLNEWCGNWRYYSPYFIFWLMYADFPHFFMAIKIPEYLSTDMCIYFRLPNFVIWVTTIFYKWLGSRHQGFMF